MWPVVHFSEKRDMYTDNVAAIIAVVHTGLVDTAHYIYANLYALLNMHI